MFIEYGILGLMTLLVLAIVVLIVVAALQAYESSGLSLGDVAFWALVIVVGCILCVSIGAAVDAMTNGFILERLRA